MAEMMTVQEVSDYLNMKEDNVILLIEAGELAGQQQGQTWQVTRASVVAYRARQLAEENASQGFEDPDR